MKPADKAFLDGLRKSVCDHIPQDHWDLVVKAVNDAGDIRDVTGYARTIILEGVEKGRFASRSEAGRYAANMRWRGSVPQGGLATAEARQEANARAGKGSGNPARGQGSKQERDALREKLYQQQSRMGAGEGASMAAIQRTLDRMDREDAEASQSSPVDSASKQDELRAFIDEQEGLLEVMQDNGESESAIAQQKRIISDAKRDSQSGNSGDSEEAQIKQAFIDAQKERLGRMGRGTSQIAHMALENGIKQLEAELASGDTSEARNRPGQFFDDRPGAKGEKYIGHRPNKEVAVDIRRDLKDAVASGELPAGLKFGVKMGSGGSSITVTVKGISNPRVRDDLGRDVTSPEAKAVYDKVNRITNAYNRDNSEMMTDYFDTDYYGFVTIEG